MKSLEHFEKGEDMPKEKLSTEQEFEEFFLELFPNIPVEVMEWCLQNKDEVKRLLHIPPFSEEEKAIKVLFVGSGLKRGMAIKDQIIAEELLFHICEHERCESLLNLNTSQLSDPPPKKHSYNSCHFKQERKIGRPFNAVARRNVRPHWLKGKGLHFRRSRSGLPQKEM